MGVIWFLYLCCKGVASKARFAWVMVKVAADTYEHLGHQTRASEVIALALAATTTTGVSVMLQGEGGSVVTSSGCY